MEEDMSKLKSGWTLNEGGTVYHFQHIPMTEAEERAEAKKESWVVETINWTLADEKTCHFNKYFSYDLTTAIAIAARIEMLAQDVAEDVVDIRRATAEEEEMYWTVNDHFDALKPPAISEKEANDL